MGFHDPHRRSRGPRRRPGAPKRRCGSGITPAARSQAADGRTLGAWLAARPPDRCPAHLPYLMKLLAAASSLSIQAHPSRERGRRGASRGRMLPASRATRRSARTGTDNHKPELIVALSDTFTRPGGRRAISTTPAACSPPSGTAGRRWPRGCRARMPPPRSATRSQWLLAGDSTADDRRDRHLRPATAVARSSPPSST